MFDRSSSPPEKYRPALTGVAPLVWATVDLSRTGRFDEELLVLTDGVILRVCLSAGALAVERHALDPSHPPELVEKNGFLLLVHGTQGEELARATISALPALSAFREAVIDHLHPAEGRATETPPPAICPKCGGNLQDSRCQSCHDTRHPFLRLAHEVRSLWGYLFLAAMLLVLSTAAGLFTPFLVKLLVDGLISAKPSADRAYLLIGTMALMIGMTQALVHARQILDARLKGALGHRLRLKAFLTLSSLSLPEVAQATPGGLAQTVISDVAHLVELVALRLSSAAFDLLMVVGTFCSLLWLSPWLGVAVFLPAPLVYFAVKYLTRRGHLLLTRDWIENVLLNSQVYNLVHGFRVVKAYAAEKRLTAAFERQSRSRQHWQQVVEIHYARFLPVMSVATGLGTLLIWGYGGYQVVHGHIGVGTLVAYVYYVGMLYGHAQGLIQMAAALPRFKTSCERFFELLDTVPTVHPPEKPRRPDHWTGAIRLEGVCFSYVPGRQVLHDINLTIEPGEMIGLVGRSGGGKSSIVNLIARFYDPTRGQITIDGIPLKELDLDELRRRIGIVLQNPFLLDGTVLENLRVGRPDATFRQVCEAADRAQAHDFILKLPDGYDTLLSNNLTISVGERQRLTIASALLADPTILILDEATASVDTQTEALIQEALSELVKNRTTIAIAHRLSTLNRADRLAVVDAGRVVDCGTHSSLLARPGIYRDLVLAQADVKRGDAVRGQGGPA